MLHYTMIQIPSNENIDSAIKIRDEMLSWNRIYLLLYNEFCNNKENNDFYKIGYKIELVDKLYNCNLKLNKRAVAKAILDLEIDQKFKTTEPEQLVKIIADIKFPEYNRSVGFVFSSKYCHFHYPNKFPIYDRFAIIALSDLAGKPIKNYKKNYSRFKIDLDILISKVTSVSSYAEIDKYLWLYGQWLFYKKKESQNKKVFSRRMRYLIKTYKTLFIKLEP